MGNHRADHRGHKHATSPSAPTPVGGRRKAVKRAATTSAKRIPTGPSIVGAAALVIAAGGAISMGAGSAATAAAPSNVRLSSGTSSVLSGTDAFVFTAGNDERATAISRDTERQALQDAASQKLQAAAEEQAAQRNATLASLAKDAEKRAGEIKKNQWKLPTVGYHLTARFGQAGGLWSSNHTGLDFAAPTGTPIFAVANGVITKTGYAGPYGNQTILTLADGTEIWFNHQSSITVNVGDTVTGGQTIGAIGSTGNVTGPHLHLEVRPGGGDPVDPYTALVYHGLNP